MLTFSVNGQVDTSINSRIKVIENQTLTMQNNLNKCHKQWVDGLGINIFGLGVSALGVVIVNQNYNNYSANSGNIKPSNYKNNENVGLIITGVGGLAMLVGTIIMIDSHKYIGKAGLGIDNNGIVYKFN